MQPLSLFPRLCWIAHERRGDLARFDGSQDRASMMFQPLDGTKIHANASRHSALSYEHAGKIEAQLNRALHQQSGRTRRAHDEASSKNLRRLPIVARCDGLRANPLPSTARKQAPRCAGKSRQPPGGLILAADRRSLTGRTRPPSIIRRSPGSSARRRARNCGCSPWRPTARFSRSR
jgi:hypothetical protein